MDTVARLLSAGRSMVSPKVGKDFHRGQYKKGELPYLSWREREPYHVRTKGRSSQMREWLPLQIPGQERYR